MSEPALEPTSSDAVIDSAKKARTAAVETARLEGTAKDAALRAMADELLSSCRQLQNENENDLKAAAAKGLSDPMLDRLRLSDEVIDRMAEGLRQVAALPDPVGEISEIRSRPNGLRVGRMRIPLGVIGIIYESRPNVTADAAGLCLKAGNAVVLRGGSEALCSNRAIVACLRAGLQKAGVTPESIQFVDTPDRDAVRRMLELEGLIDLIIPRGGEGLIRFVTQSSRIPVIQHYKGVCHTYIDRDADVAMARELAINGKVQRPSVCNATETLLVHEHWAGPHLAALAQALVDEGVELFVCERTAALLDGIPHQPATDEHWAEEFLDLRLAVRVVDSMDAAMEHIRQWGSNHTETIVTESYSRSQRFLREVDSSCVLVNASTRFADGYELGLGAEIGISTSKLHAFGPMGVEELTTRKFVVLGDGQVRG